MKKNILIFGLVMAFVTICFSKGYGANGTLADGIGAKSMGGAFTTTYHF